MNILIVGNGFDLSHYLPTKYDHFMAVMNAIENWDESKSDMGFDDLFGSLYEKEHYFFCYTKAMYKTDEIKISIEQIKNLKEQLNKNIWFRFFKHHISNIETWIDFEAQIENVLDIVSNFCEEVAKIYKTNERVDEYVHSLHSKNLEGINFLCGQNTIKILLSLQLIINRFDDFIGSESMVINPIYYRNYDKKQDIDQNYIFNKLERELRDFIEIFNFYLFEIVQVTKPSIDFNLNILATEDELKIYSFNYTSTFQRFYNPDINIEYLHGKLGVEQNIVLGISELENDTLKKIKAYGFTKYHQKLFKKTDYMFLKYNEKIIKNCKQWDRWDASRFKEDALSQNEFRTNIYIWGHSLDISDEVYIQEIFSLNTNDKDKNVRVTVYYFDNNANFDLLTNLIHILGKETVETWMKKGWLRFEKNPNIAEINGIKPVNLSRL